MKHKLIGGLALAALLVVVGFSQAMAQESNWENGTRTWKVTIGAPSGGNLGHDHTSKYAVKSDWIPVPIGKDYVLAVEQNSDSSVSLAAFAGVGVDGDTVHIALETASPMSILVRDSSESVHQHHLAKTVWWDSDLNWSGFIVSRYVAVRYTDTIAGQTNDGGLPAFGGIFPKGAYNLGMVRFSLCSDDADSLADGAITLNCFIMYHESDPNQKAYGYVPDGVEGAPYDCMEADYYSYAYVPRYSDPTWGGR